MRTPRSPLPSDITDEQWSRVEPLIPAPKTLGRSRSTDLREVINAIVYRWTTDCVWRSIPKGFPPWATVYTYFRAWRAEGMLPEMRAILMSESEREGEPDVLPIESEGDSSRRPRETATRETRTRVRRSDAA